MATSPSETTESGRLLWLPYLVFLAHSALYLGWLVDDAGISLAYAKHLAAGLGPVAQPGALPVEGYSNPLWVALFVPLYALGLVAVPWVPKLLAVSLGLANLTMLRRLTRRAAPAAPEAVTFSVCLLSALNPAVVLWVNSGLENPLYLALTLGLALTSLRAAAGQGSWTVAGLVGAGLALTRPDGLLLALAPLAWLRLSPASPPAPGGTRGYLGGFATPFLCHLILRRWMFGAWVPNTYLAKVSGGPVAALHAAALSPQTLVKLSDLGTAVAGPEVGVWLILAAALGGAWLLRREASTPAARLSTVLAAAALASYGILPRDWMGECRFATALIPLLYLVGFTALAEAAPVAPEGEPQPALPSFARVYGLGALLVLAAAPSLRWRALKAHRAPPISLDYVRRAYVEGSRRWRRAIGRDQASMLLPDIGAVLLDEPSLKVFDLAGLTDPVLARLLHGPRAELREHVLATLKPTFMHLNPAWAPELNLAKDPRFARDYAWFYRYPRLKDFEFEAAEPGYYVRREALVGRPAALATLRGEALSWKALAPRPPVTWGTLALALWPLPARAGWLPREPEGSRAPGRRRRLGLGEIRLDDVPEGSQAPTAVTTAR